MFWRVSNRLRTRSFRAAMIVLAVIGLSWGWRQWTEPRYLGRGIRSWIEQLPYDNSADSVAEEAMRYFGNDAVPYLIDAMRSSGKWESGLLAKIPKKYLFYLFDVEHADQVRRAAIGKLEELTVTEALENELQINPKHPVFDQVLPVWRHELRRNPSRIFTGLFGLAPLMTNLAPELRGRFEGMNPYTGTEWLDVSHMLAETHDPTLVPIFLRAATPTNSPMIREWAFHALARNGYGDDVVAGLLREALTSTNAHFQSSAIVACAYLNICQEEALAVTQKRRLELLEIGPTEIHTLEIYEPVIRWRANTNDVKAAEQIDQNLQAGVKYPYRLQTAEVLSRAGSAAQRFVPTLSRIVREEGPPFQIDAARALKAIDPEEARKVLVALPHRTVMHAKTAGPAR